MDSISLQSKLKLGEKLECCNKCSKTTFCKLFCIKGIQVLVIFKDEQKIIYISENVCYLYATIYGIDFELGTEPSVTLVNESCYSLWTFENRVPKDLIQSITSSTIQPGQGYSVYKTIDGYYVNENSDIFGARSTTNPWILYEFLVPVQIHKIIMKARSHSSYPSKFDDIEIGTGLLPNEKMFFKIPLKNA